MFIMLFFFILFFLLRLLLGVAFLTLLERRFLGAVHFRVGPLKVGLIGLFQPFSDALRLFGRIYFRLVKLNFFFYFIRPFYGFFFVLMIYLVYYYFGGYINVRIGWLLVMLLVSMNLYFLLGIRWSSVRVYRFYGCIRAVCQALAYEVVLIFFLLIFIIVRGVYEFDFDEIIVWFNLVWFFPLYVLWFIILLFETNRTPYDLSEGESELVRGFNTEYYGGMFSLVFIVEYASLIFIGFLMMIFLNLSFIYLIFIYLFVILFILWVRRAYPRIRYDVLMIISWKYILMYVLFNYFLLLFF